MFSSAPLQYELSGSAIAYKKHQSWDLLIRTTKSKNLSKFWNFHPNSNSLHLYQSTYYQ